MLAPGYCAISLFILLSISELTGILSDNSSLSMAVFSSVAYNPAASSALSINIFCCSPADTTLRDIWLSEIFFTRNVILSPFETLASPVRCADNKEPSLKPIRT